MACLMVAMGGCSADISSTTERPQTVLPADAHLVPIPRSGQKAARRWMKGEGLDLKQLEVMPVTERAARLNQAVYNYCESGTATSPHDLNELFENCQTACGGFSYVLRSALEATGIRTRFVHLYNIPNQGNHTAIEVDVGGRWALFDPTFGVFFTSDGTASGYPLSLSEVAGTKSEEDLSKMVLQAVDAPNAAATISIDALYSETFGHLYMELRNYLVAEALSFEDPREWRMLEIDLRLKRGRGVMGDFTSEDFQSLNDSWLADTNDLLNNDDLTDDTSFNASRLWSSLPYLTTLSVGPLDPGMAGEISILLWNPDSQHTDLQLMALGKSGSLNSERILSVPPGRSELKFPFMAHEPQLRIGLKNLGAVPVIHLFGVAAETG